MGSDRFYPEERPVRPASVNAFLMDATPATNAQFAQFVMQTGYVTDAEKGGSSHVFVMTGGPVDLRQPSQWWKVVEGACWHSPDGPTAGLKHNPEHLDPDFARLPVVHVSLQDAKAYARWCKGQLPTEAQWEYAARGGLVQADFAWGNVFTPEGQAMAHTWKGSFPWQYSAENKRPAPLAVGSLPANGYGLYDMIGNVWEWTLSPFDLREQTQCPCSLPASDSRLWTLKGGSFLCAAEYCLRYRPAARIGASHLTSTSHIGFRCVYTDGPNLRTRV